MLLPALAAAVVGRMRSLPTTVFAAVAISVVAEATQFSLDKDKALVDFGLLVLIGVGLLLQQRKALRGGDEAATAWQASEEQRPIPKELLTVPAVRLTRRILVVIGLLAVAIFPFVTSTGQTNLGGIIALNAIVALSLVVLTGWAGQVSLGQFAFVAVGAVVAGALTAKVGLTFWLAVPLAVGLHRRLRRGRRPAGIADPGPVPGRDDVRLRRRRPLAAVRAPLLRLAPARRHRPAHAVLLRLRRREVDVLPVRGRPGGLDRRRASTSARAASAGC